jgi:arylsulfatase
MFCNRGIYHKGWTAVTKHRTPWLPMSAKLPSFDADCWELYDTTNDWSQAHDLAKEQPDKLAELQRLWLIEATKYNVLPLDDRGVERFNSESAGRPQLVKGGRQLLFGGMGRLTEGSILNLHNKSYAVTADIVVPKEDAEGVIIALGGLTGGWSLYAKGGKAKHCYNFFGLEEYIVEGKTRLPEGRHQVRVEFAYDGGGPAKGGKLTLYLDGKPDGEGRIERTEPQIFSADETCDIGTEFGSAVTNDYAHREFNGVVNWVQLDQGEDAKNAEHYIKPEERLHLAMAVQ